MPIRFAPLLACAVWLTATAAIAQIPPPSSPVLSQTPSVEAPAPPTPVSPLTVQAPPANRAELEKQARRFVEAYAAATAKLDRYARWNRPACVAVTGVAPEQGAPIKARIEAVARTVGAPVAAAGCKANIEILFTAEPQATLQAVAARNAEVFGHDAKTMTRPIQAWYATETLGSPPPPSGPVSTPPPAASVFAMSQSTATDRFRVNQGAMAARRCVDFSAPNCPHSGFLNVLVVVDAGHMGDVSLELTADYVALLALSQPQPRSLDGCLALPSVLDLYASACARSEAPGGLTSADLAYLRSLYAADLTLAKSGEQSDIALRMATILAGGDGASR